MLTTKSATAEPGCVQLDSSPAVVGTAGRCDDGRSSGSTNALMPSDVACEVLRRLAPVPVYPVQRGAREANLPCTTREGQR